MMIDVFIEILQFIGLIGGLLILSYLITDVICYLMVANKRDRKRRHKTDPDKRG